MSLRYSRLNTFFICFLIFLYSLPLSNTSTTSHSLSERNLIINQLDFLQVSSFSHNFSFRIDISSVRYYRLLIGLTDTDEYVEVYSKDIQSLNGVLSSKQEKIDFEIKDFLENSSFSFEVTYFTKKKKEKKVSIILFDMENRTDNLMEISKVSVEGDYPILEHEIKEISYEKKNFLVETNKIFNIYKILINSNDTSSRLVISGNKQKEQSFSYEIYYSYVYISRINLHFQENFLIPLQIFRDENENIEYYQIDLRQSECIYLYIKTHHEKSPIEIEANPLLINKNKFSISLYKQTNHDQNRSIESSQINAPDLNIRFTYINNSKDFKLEWTEPDQTQHNYYVYLNDRLINNIEYKNINEVLENKDKMLLVSFSNINEYYSYALIYDSTVFDVYVVSETVDSEYKELYTPLRKKAFCRDSLKPNERKEILITSQVEKYNLCLYKADKSFDLNGLYVFDDKDFPINESISLKVYEDLNNILNFNKIDKEIIEFQSSSLEIDYNILSFINTISTSKKIFKIEYLNFKQGETPVKSINQDEVFKYKANINSFLIRLRVDISSASLLSNRFQLQVYSDKSNITLELFKSTSKEALITYYSQGKVGVESDAIRPNASSGNYYFIITLKKEDLSKTSFDISVLLLTYGSNLYKENDIFRMNDYSNSFNVKSILNKKLYLIVDDNDLVKQGRNRYFSFSSIHQVKAVESNTKIEEITKVDFENEATSHFVFGKENRLQSQKTKSLLLITIDFIRDKYDYDVSFDLIFYSTSENDIDLSEEESEYAYNIKRITDKSPFIFDLNRINFLMDTDKVSVIINKKSTISTCRLVFAIGINNFPFKINNQIKENDVSFEIDYSLITNGVRINEFILSIDNIISISSKPNLKLVVFSDSDCDNIDFSIKRVDDKRYFSYSLSETSLIKHNVLVDNHKKDYILISDIDYLKEVLLYRSSFQNTFTICYEYISKSINSTEYNSLFSIFNFNNCSFVKDKSLVVKGKKEMNLILRIDVEQKDRSSFGNLFVSYITDVNSFLTLSFSASAFIRINNKDSSLALVTSNRKVFGNNIKLIISGIVVPDKIGYKIDERSDSIYEEGTIQVNISNQNNVISFKNQKESPSILFIEVRTDMPEANYQYLNLENIQKTGERNVNIKLNPVIQDEVFNKIIFLDVGYVKETYKARIRLNSLLSNAYIQGYKLDILSTSSIYFDDKLYISPNPQYIQSKCNGKYIDLSVTDSYGRLGIVLYLKISSSSIDQDSFINFSIGNYLIEDINLLTSYQFKSSQIDIRKVIRLPNVSSKEKLFLILHHKSKETIKKEGNKCFFMTSFSNSISSIEDLTYGESNERTVIKVEYDNYIYFTRLYLTCKYEFEVIFSQFLLEKTIDDVDFTRKYSLPLIHRQIGIEKTSEISNDCNDDYKLSYTIKVKTLLNQDLFKYNYFLIVKSSNTESQISFDDFLSSNNSRQMKIDEENEFAYENIVLNTNKTYMISVIFYDFIYGIIGEYNTLTPKTDSYEKSSELTEGLVSRLDHSDILGCGYIKYKYILKTTQKGEYFMSISSFDKEFIKFELKSTSIPELNVVNKEYIHFSVQNEDIFSSSFELIIYNTPEVRRTNLKTLFLYFNKAGSSHIDVNQSLYQIGYFVNGDSNEFLFNLTEIPYYLDFLIVMKKSFISSVDVEYSNKEIVNFEVNKKDFSYTFSNDLTSNKYVKSIKLNKQTSKSNQANEEQNEQFDFQFIFYKKQLRAVEISDLGYEVGIIYNTLTINYIYNFKISFDSTELKNEIRLNQVDKLKIVSAKILPRSVKEDDFPITNSDNIIINNGNGVRLHYENRVIEDYNVIFSVKVKENQSTDVMKGRIEVSKCPIVIKDISEEVRLSFDLTMSQVQTIKIFDTQRLVYNSNLYILSHSKEELYMKISSSLIGNFIDEVKESQDYNQVFDLLNNDHDYDMRLYKLVLNHKDLLFYDSINIYISFSSLEKATKHISLSIISTNIEYSQSTKYDQGHSGYFHSSIIPPFSSSYIIYRLRNIRSDVSISNPSEFIITNEAINLEDLSDVTVTFSPVNEVYNLKKGFSSFEEDVFYKVIDASDNLITSQVSDLYIIRIKNNKYKTIVINTNINQVINSAVSVYNDDDAYNYFDIGSSAVNNSYFQNLKGKAYLEGRLLFNIYDKVIFKFNDETIQFDYFNKASKVVDYNERTMFYIRRNEKISNSRVIVSLKVITNKENIVINPSDVKEFKMKNGRNTFSLPVKSSDLNNDLSLFFKSTTKTKSFDFLSVSLMYMNTYSSDKGIVPFFKSSFSLSKFISGGFDFGFINFNSKLINEVRINIDVNVSSDSNHSLSQVTDDDSALFSYKSYSLDRFTLINGSINSIKPINIEANSGKTINLQVPSGKERKNYIFIQTFMERSLELLSDIPLLTTDMYQIIETDNLQENFKYKAQYINKSLLSSSILLLYSFIDTYSPSDFDKYSGTRKINASIKDFILTIEFDSLLTNQAESVENIQYFIVLYDILKYNPTSTLDAFSNDDKAESRFIMYNINQGTINLTGKYNKILSINVYAYDANTNYIKIYDNLESYLSTCNTYGKVNENIKYELTYTSPKIYLCFVVDPSKTDVFDFIINEHSINGYSRNKNMKISIFFKGSYLIFENELNIQVLLSNQLKTEKILSVTVMIELLNDLEDSQVLSFNTYFNDYTKPFELVNNKLMEFVPNDTIAKTFSTNKESKLEIDSPFNLIVVIKDKNKVIKFNGEVNKGQPQIRILVLPDYTVDIYKVNEDSLSIRLLQSKSESEIDFVKILFQDNTIYKNNYLILDSLDILNKGITTLIKNKQFLVIVNRNIILSDDIEIFTYVIYSKSIQSIYSIGTSKDISDINDTDFPTDSTQDAYIGKDMLLKTKAGQLNDKYLLIRIIGSNTLTDSNFFNISLYNYPLPIHITSIDKLRVDLKDLSFTSPVTYYIKPEEFLLETDTISVFNNGYSQYLNVFISVNSQVNILNIENSISIEGDYYSKVNFSKSLFSTIDFDKDLLLSDHKDNKIFISIFNTNPNDKEKITSSIDIQSANNKKYILTDISMTRSIQVGLDNDEKMLFHVINTFDEDGKKINIFLNNYINIDSRKGIVLKIKTIKKSIFSLLKSIDSLFNFNDTPIFDGRFININNNEDFIVEIFNNKQKVLEEESVNDELYIEYFVFGASSIVKTVSKGPVFIDYDYKLSLYAPGNYSTRKYTFASNNQYNPYNNITICGKKYKLNDTLSFLKGDPCLISVESNEKNNTLLIAAPTSYFAPVSHENSIINNERFAFYSLKNKRNDNHLINIDKSIISNKIESLSNNIYFEIGTNNQNIVQTYFPFVNVPLSIGQTNYRHFKLNKINTKKYEYAYIEIKNDEKDSVTHSFFSGSVKSRNDSEGVIQELNLLSNVNEEIVIVNQQKPVLELSFYKNVTNTYNDCQVVVKEAGYSEKFSITEMKKIVSLSVQNIKTPIIKVNILCKRINFTTESNDIKDIDNIVFYSYAFVENEYKSYDFNDVESTEYSFSHTKSGETNTYNLVIKDYKKYNQKYVDMEYFGIIIKKQSNITIYDYLYNANYTLYYSDTNGEIVIPTYGNTNYTVKLFGRDKHSGVLIDYQTKELIITPETEETSNISLFVLFIIILGSAAVLSMIIYGLYKLYLKKSKINDDSEGLGNEINKEEIDESHVKINN